MQIVGDDFGVALDNFSDSLVGTVGKPIRSTGLPSPSPESAVGSYTSVANNGLQFFVRDVDQPHMDIYPLPFMHESDN
jgi:hypothetical protein